ncbi:MAG: bifunctional adenosylcobinamide kinase/adenosylcobinamide-phosphate guanylyltransferase [Thermodesulfobacteriota bacterium]
MPKKIVFITGGVRSGKSQFALQIGKEYPGPKAYLATAQALDKEMAQRIKRHKESRAEEWQTIEEPREIVKTIKERGAEFGIILIDCLTLWISNLLLTGWSAEKILRETDDFLKVAHQIKCSLIIVSNEVGWGIVPDNEVARSFRDITGIVHQKLGQEADEVYLMVCGLPHRLKGIDE